MRKAKKFVGLLAMLALVLSAGLAYGQTICVPTVWNLTAGQTIDVGSVTVTNDATNIYVTYKLDYPNAVFGTLQMWVGTDLSVMPQNDKGTPIPGQFCQINLDFCHDATGLTEYTFTIPWSDVVVSPSGELQCGDTVYVVTHAEVDMDGDPATEDHETAFGGPTPGSGPRWWFYGLYEICCGTPPPPSECYRETAFAKGGYVFTTDKKSNPEKLLSLNLIKNRWGWAINLTAPGTTTYDIWAGAGLNNTANGKKVGTLTVLWDGSQVNVTYSLIDGYYLEEVHLYAGDFKPTTVAPGQYGNLAGDIMQPGYTFPEPIAASDSDSDGIWLIAHAVVTNGECENEQSPE